MTFQNEPEGPRKRKTDPEIDSAAGREPGTKKRKPANEVGDALKCVYQRTVEEDIPPEMLDLLGKLG